MKTPTEIASAWWRSLCATNFGLEGYVIVHQAEAVGWSRQLNTPQSYEPGCFAVPVRGGVICRASGLYHDRTHGGAACWKPTDQVAPPLEAPLVKLVPPSRVKLTAPIACPICGHRDNVAMPKKNEYACDHCWNCFVWVPDTGAKPPPEAPAPPAGVLETIIQEVIAHGKAHPDHGVGCHCMDEHIGALRRALPSSGGRDLRDPKADWDDRNDQDCKNGSNVWLILYKAANRL